ncbi:E3 ubiquitin-protein ligase HRD1 [Fusarium oxysporum f. sp. phaseoli]
MPVQEDFWPSLKAFAENNGVASLETLGLECVVCNEPFQYRRRDDDDAGSPRRPRVLPCGHILCGRCLLAYYETGESRCPTCRTELIHECGHAHTGMPMPLTRLDSCLPSCHKVEELSNSPDIAEELKGEYLGIGIKLSNSDEYCSRDVTGPVLEIEPPAAIKQLINDIVDSAIESQRENEVWLEADFSSMKIRVLHFKPELLSEVEESPAEQETVSQDGN